MENTNIFSLYYPSDPEIWVDIPDYEGLYQVSSLGRFKALDKSWNCGEFHAVSFSKKEHFLKYGNHRDGYLTIVLSKNGEAKTFLSHIIVAKLFVSNPHNKKEVNHLDGDKKNIACWNLIWATRSENIQHAFDSGLKVGLKRGKHGCAKIVLDTKTGIFYDCAKDAADAKNIKYHNLINQLCGVVSNKSGLIYA